MTWPYFWILHCVSTLYGQMVEVNSLNHTCIKMISASVCFFSFLLNPASSCSIDRFQPLRRESSRPTDNTLLPPPADDCLFPTVKSTNIVGR